MSAPSPIPNAHGEVPLGELLAYLEQSGRVGEARLETSVGVGRIWFRDGRLVDIELDGSTGVEVVEGLTRAAIYSYAIEYRAVCRFPALDDASLSLLGRPSWRALEWQRLVSTMPSLDSVLSVNESRLHRERGSLSDTDLALLGLVDGRRAVIDVVSDSGLELVEATQRVAWYCRVGLVRASRGSRAPLSSSPALREGEPGDGMDAAGERTPRGYGVAVPLPPRVPAFPAGSSRDSDAPRARMASIQPAPTIALGDRQHGTVGSRRREASRTQVGLGAVRAGPPDPTSARELDAMAAPSATAAEPAAVAASHDEQAASASSEGGTSGERRESNMEGILTAPRFVGGLDPPSFHEGLDDLGLAAEPADGTEQPEPSSVDASAERIVLGRYEVLSRIARGGMGTVYLCRARGEGGFRRLFALKVLRGHLAHEPRAARMFLEEARLAARIYHPHVVGIIDVGSQGDQPYIVMDYVEGGSMQELLDRYPHQRPPRLIVPIILDALSGLHAAHTLEDDDGAPLELVHCDVSPHNLLVGLDGSCRLSDFGVARMLRGAHGPRHGKPAFIAPEQLETDQVDARTDVFSMGVVLWTALTGEPLFEADTVGETLDNVRKKPIAPPSSCGLRPPACFDAVCLKALRRDPAERYQSAGEMLRELRAVAMSEDHLAPATEIADWVRATLGADVQARRMAALDASRRGRAPGAVTRVLPDVDRPSEVPEGERSARRRSSSRPPPPSMPPSSSGAPPPLAPTMVLEPRRDLRNVIGTTAATCLVLTGLVLLFPEWFASLFRVGDTATGPLEAVHTRARPSEAAAGAPGRPRADRAPDRSDRAIPGQTPAKHGSDEEASASEASEIERTKVPPSAGAASAFQYRPSPGSDEAAEPGK